jgi:hypothetical protein
MNIKEKKRKLLLHFSNALKENWVEKQPDKEALKRFLESPEDCYKVCNFTRWVTVICSWLIVLLILLSLTMTKGQSAETLILWVVCALIFLALFKARKGVRLDIGLTGIFPYQEWKPIRRDLIKTGLLQHLAEWDEEKPIQESFEGWVNMKQSQISYWEAKRLPRKKEEVEEILKIGTEAAEKVGLKLSFEMKRQNLRNVVGMEEN